MIRSLFLIILFLFNGFTHAAKETTGTVLVVGDSISAAYGIDPDSGWVSLLAIKIAQEKKPYQVINASISGDTTINGLNRLVDLLKKYKPQVVILELGGNDGLRGLSVKTIKQNLKQMIETSQQHKAKVLLAGMKIPPNYGKRYTDAFYKVYIELAQEQQVELIPFILEGVGGNAKLIQNDGIHPTQAAQPVILKWVWEKLQPML